MRLSDKTVGQPQSIIRSTKNAFSQNRPKFISVFTQACAKQQMTCIQKSTHTHCRKRLFFREVDEDVAVGVEYL